MSQGQVSELWENLLEKEEAYFPKDDKLLFFRRILSSRWVSNLLKYGVRRRYLEAGCGLGRFGIAIASVGKEVTLLDCSENSLRGAKCLKDIAEKHFGKMSVSFMKGDLESVNTEGRQFDVTFNEGVLEHWTGHDERVAVIRRMADMTNIGGLVSVRVVNNKNPMYNFLYLAALKDTIPAYHRYDLKELEGEMKAAGLRIVCSDGETVNDPGDWVKSKWLADVLMFFSILINKLPQPLRKSLCPSIFCIGVVE